MCEALWCFRGGRRLYTTSEAIRMADKGVKGLIPATQEDIDRVNGPSIPF